MTAPNIQWYDSSDVLLTAEQAIGAINPGSSSTPLELHVWNNKGGSGADTAENRFMQVVVQNVGESIFVGTGHEAVEDQWLEVKILADTLGTLTLAAGSFQRLGSGQSFELPAIPNDGGIALEFKWSPSAGATNADVKASIRITKRASVPVPAGLTELGGDGINLGLGDAAVTQLLAMAGDAVENGTPDDKVEVQDTRWVHAGALAVVLKHLETISAVDGDSATLIAGETYFALIYAASDGTIKQAKGSKTSTPSSTDEPALPSGGRNIAMITREFDALINDADIDNRWVEEASGIVVDAASLTVQIGPTRAIVDNNLIRTSFLESLLLTASSTNRIWRNPDGALEATTTATAPETRSNLLWEAVTDGSGVTSTVDKRAFYSTGLKLQRLEFLFDATLVATDAQKAAFASPRDGIIVPLWGVAAFLYDDPGSGGSVIFDINLRAPGGSFTTIYTSQGSEDRRPTIANAATNLDDRDSIPEVVDVSAYSVLECVVDAITSGGAPTGALVVVFIAVT